MSKYSMCARARLYKCTFQGRRMPLKKSGIHMGNTTASLSSFLASSRSAMSSLQMTKEIQLVVLKKKKTHNKKRKGVCKNLCAWCHTSVHWGYVKQYLSPVNPQGRCHILCHQTSSALYPPLRLQPLSFPDGKQKINKTENRYFFYCLKVNCTLSLCLGLVLPGFSFPLPASLMILVKSNNVLTCELAFYSCIYGNCQFYL